MDSKILGDEIECDCTPTCFCKSADSRWIQNQCLDADFYFGRLGEVVKLQADLKKGIEPRNIHGDTFKEAGVDFLEYRVVSIIAAHDLIQDIEKCACARKVIKNTDYEKIYFEAREKYSEAIDKLMKISNEDILRLEKDSHYEIDL